MDLYLIWFIAALLMIVLEIFTSSFVMMWFGIGAALAGLLALLGVDSVAIQVSVFALSSLSLVAVSRTVARKFFHKDSPGRLTKTNMDALIGKIGVVTEQIDNELSCGRVLVESQDWAARSIDGNIITNATKVKVVDFEGVKLIVTSEI